MRNIEKGTTGTTIGVFLAIYLLLCTALFVHDVQAEQAWLQVHKHDDHYQIALTIWAKDIYTCPEVEWPAEKELVWHCYPMDSDGKVQSYDKPTGQTWKRYVRLDPGHWIFRVYVQKDGKVIASDHTEKEIP